MGTCSGHGDSHSLGEQLAEAVLGEGTCGSLGHPQIEEPLCTPIPSPGSSSPSPGKGRLQYPPGLGQVLPPGWGMLRLRGTLSRPWGISHCLGHLLPCPGWGLTQVGFLGLTATQGAEQGPALHC